MRQAKTVLVLLSFVAMIAHAQSSTEDRGSAQETQVRGYWIDPSTGLMWAGRDNGKDVNWHKAMKYCRGLRLDKYSDWRLATIDELQGIYDRSAKAPGLAGKHRDESFNFPVKGYLFLTGHPWSSTQRTDDRGHDSGLAWIFDFTNGRRYEDDAVLPASTPNTVGGRCVCAVPGDEVWVILRPFDRVAVIHVPIFSKQTATRAHKIRSRLKYADIGH